MECLPSLGRCPILGGGVFGRSGGRAGNLLLDSKFPVLGVWIGALGQVTTVRGGGWSGRFSFQLKISTVWLGKGSVSVECAVRLAARSGMTPAGFETRTHAQNHCAMECHPSLGEGTNPKK